MGLGRRQLVGLGQGRSSRRGRLALERKGRRGKGRKGSHRKGPGVRDSRRGATRCRLGRRPDRRLAGDKAANRVDLRSGRRLLDSSSRLLALDNTGTLAHRSTDSRGRRRHRSTDNRQGRSKGSLGVRSTGSRGLCRSKGER